MSNTKIVLSTIGTRKSPKVLLNAWYELKRNTSKRHRATSCGIDGITIDDFEKNLSDNLTKISHKIRYSDDFRFSELKPILIKKKNNKDRLICIPTVEDRIVQKAIQITFNNIPSFKYTRFNGINFGFVVGRSVKEAINKAVKQRNKNQYIYKTDISSFFDSISRIELKRVVREKIRNKSIFPIIDAAIDCEIAETYGSYSKRIGALKIKKGIGIRQGMPLSPFFANLFLDDFDNIIKKKEYRCVRYADDLIFFSSSYKNCLEIHNFCKDELIKIGLTIPEIEDNSKTEIICPDEEVDFLGMTISMSDKGGYRPFISDKQYKAIKDALYNYSDMNYLHSREITLRNYAQKIIATINGYKAVYSECEDAKEFFKILDNFEHDVIRKLFKKEFDIEWDRLTEKHQKFLEL